MTYLMQVLDTNPTFQRGGTPAGAPKRKRPESWFARLLIKLIRRRGFEVVDPTRLAHARGRVRAIETLTDTSGALTNGAQYAHARRKIRTYTRDALFHLEGSTVYE